MDDKPITVEKTDVRQGVTGHGVRYVLQYGLAGAVIVLAIIYLVFLR